MKLKEFEIFGGALGGFNNIYHKTSVTIPSNVTKIGDYVFWNCYDLTSIEVPGCVIEIGNCAFLSCESLTSITIPESVIKIGKRAFDNCPNLINFNASDEKFYLLDNDNQYELICNFIREYNNKNTYTEDDINRYKKFIMLTKEKMISGLKIEITSFVSETRASMKPLDYTKIEEINEKFDEEYLMPILANKPLIEFMCYNMKNAFTLKEISRLIDVAIKTDDTEIKTLLLQYKNKHFGDEFIDDLSLDEEDYEFGNNLDDDLGKSK